MFIIPYVREQDFFGHGQIMYSTRIQAICRRRDFHTFRGQVYLLGKNE